MSDIQQANVPASTVTLLASAARTTTGAGTAVDGFAAARLLVLQLNVTAASARCRLLAWQCKIAWTALTTTLLLLLLQLVE